METGSRGQEDSPIIETTLRDHESPSTAVPLTVAAVSDQTISELPPLFDAVDPDALDEVFLNRQSSGFVTFPFHEHVVVLHSDGTIAIHDDRASVGIDR